MGEIFNQMVTVFNKLGNVNPTPIKFKNGKNSKFSGKVSSNLGTSVIKSGEYFIMIGIEALELTKLIKLFNRPSKLALMVH